jgi:hypothetical protein
VFKEVKGLEADITIALGKTNKETGKPYPKQAEGYYLGSRSVENKRGESKIHFLQTPKGNLGLWGTTDLNRKMANAPIGSMVRITSTGTKATPNGEMYTYKVEVDDTNTIEVAAPAEETAAKSNYHDDEEADLDDVLGEGPGYEDETPAPALVASSDRQAKVKELLAKKRK